MTDTTTAAPPAGKKRVLINLASNQVGFFLPAIITFFLSPFVVHTLGDNLYGLWSLVASFAGHYGLLTMGIQSATTRYVAYAAGKEDRSALSRYASSAFWLLVPAGAISVAVGSGLAAFLEPIFRIPQEDLSAAQVACVIIALSTGVTFATAIFHSILTAFQRFDTLNVVKTSAIIVRSLLTVWLLLEGFRIVALAFLTLGVALASGAVFYALARRQCEGWRVSREHVDRSSVKTLLGYGMKSLVGTASLTLAYQVDLFVIGIFLTPASITMYSLGSTLLFYVVQFVNSIVHVIDPYATQRFARRGVAGVRGLFLSGSPFLYVLGGTIVGCALPLARPFFSVWIDPEHVQSGTILAILVVPQFFNIGARFGHCMLVGMARIGTFNTVALIGGLAKLLLSVILIQRWGIVGVAVGTLIPMVIVDAIWFVRYMSRLLEVSPARIWTHSIGPGLLVAVAGLLAGTGITRLLPPVGWVPLAADALLTLLSCVAVAWFVLPARVGGIAWRTEGIDRLRRRVRGSRDS